MNNMTLPDILNSRTQKVLLELPNYAYSHTSSTEDKTHSFFIGRKNLIERLKSLIISTSSKTGVYLVTGNRGVGKSSLVDKVIDKTSLSKSGSNIFTFLFVLLFLVLGLQYISNQVSSSVINISEKQLAMWFLIIDAILFFVIGYHSFVRKKNKEYNKRRFCETLWRTILASIKELSIPPNSSNPYVRTRNVLNLVFILLGFQILSLYLNLNFTLFKLFIIYLCAMASTYLAFHSNKNLIDECRKNRLIIPQNLSLYQVYHRCMIPLSIVFGLALLASFSFVIMTIQLDRSIDSYYPFHLNLEKTAYFWKVIILCIGIALIVDFIKILIFIPKDFNKKDWKQIIKYTIIWLIVISVKQKIDNYIRNNGRIYLKINFGNDVLKEREVLRLITRTLTTEYNKFCRSWKHNFYWRILALAIVLSATHLFYKNICSQTPLEKTYTISQEERITAEKTIEIHTKDITYSEKNMQKKLPKNKNLQHYEPYLSKVDTAINKTCYFIRNAPLYFWTHYKETDKIRIEKTKFEEIKNYGQNNCLYVNYSWWLIFFVFYLLGNLLLRLRLFTTHYTIQKQLELLNESITYNIEKESEARYGYIQNYSPHLSLKKKKSRIIADSREIEKELQDILNTMQQIPAFMARPEFVIVFDELDKVSPETPAKDALTQEGKHKEAWFAQNSTRERQAVILKLLSNMKYFLSTANAKFIFIAGREMYDMYLADIADRNNYFGSIFNDVIFVPSFLTDKSNTKEYDITTLVEEFVCRHLIPEHYPNTEWNLKNYRQYLEDIIYCNAKDKKSIIKYFKDKKKYEVQRKIILLKWQQEREVQQKIQKIIAILQHFIIYLSHTSKGAPKKMIQVFESFIDNYIRHEMDEKELVVKQFRHSNFFLTFDFYAQYTVGMTSYLLSPVLYLLTDANIQEHSDKLLVSTLNFVDYMLKFHNQNFSWRQLDISPEIIETNHSPELKAVIKDVMTLFEQTHLGT